MIAQTKILIAIDDSGASWKAVEYVANWYAATVNSAYTFFTPRCLASATPGIPRRRGGRRGKRTPRPTEAETGALEAARPTGRGARSQPCAIDIGESGGGTESRVPVLLQGEDLAEEILRAARECDCSKIVVGRNSFPWLREAFADHLDETLQQRAQGMTIHVIE